MSESWIWRAVVAVCAGRSGAQRAVGRVSRGAGGSGASSFFFFLFPTSLQVVLLGEGSVGKTSLVLRYCKDEFNDKHLTTIQASFFAKRITVGQARVKLAIWDTAGQERYAALGPIYYRDANGALLVYDITDRQSFDRVKQWVGPLCEAACNAADSTAGEGAEEDEGGRVRAGDHRQQD